jgi:hypothetical protein
MGWIRRARILASQEQKKLTLSIAAVYATGSAYIARNRGLTQIPVIQAIHKRAAPFFMEAASFEVFCRVLRYCSALKEMNDDRDHRKKQQQVNQRTRNVKYQEPAEPQKQQNDE